VAPLIRRSVERPLRNAGSTASTGSSSNALRAEQGLVRLLPVTLSGLPGVKCSQPAFARLPPCREHQAEPLSESESLPLRGEREPCELAALCCGLEPCKLAALCWGLEPCEPAALCWGLGAPRRVLHSHAASEPPSAHGVLRRHSRGGTAASAPAPLPAPALDDSPSLLPDVLCCCREPSCPGALSTRNVIAARATPAVLEPARP
jgi:hypothetical protein